VTQREKQQHKRSKKQASSIGTLDSWKSREQLLQTTTAIEANERGGHLAWLDDTKLAGEAIYK